MEYVFNKNVLKIKQDEIDIYDSATFKDVMKKSIKRKGITLDLSMVEEVSTSAIQVIMSAMQSMDGLKLKGVTKEVKRNLFLLGVSF